VTGTNDLANTNRRRITPQLGCPGQWGVTYETLHLLARRMTRARPAAVLLP
jgi:hypothetical protein